MKLPCYHIIYYKGFAIYYLNGFYKVPELAQLSYFNMDAAKAIVDEYEAEQQSQNEQKLFDNQKSTDAKNTIGY